MLAEIFFWKSIPVDTLIWVTKVPISLSLNFNLSLTYQYPFLKIQLPIEEEMQKYIFFEKKKILFIV